MGELTALTRLQRLGLAGTTVTDAGLALVRPLAALRELSLDWCQRFTDSGVQAAPRLPHAPTAPPRGSSPSPPPPPGSNREGGAKALSWHAHPQQWIPPGGHAPLRPSDR